LKDHDSEVVEELTKEGRAEPRSPLTPPPNPYVDALFKSWGGKPEHVNNWQAIALSFLEVAVYQVVGGKAKERAKDGSS
jgi:hypothetical protein